MNTINDRIARCIVESNLTKTAFAQKIGLTQAYVSALSIGRKKTSDRTISDICREFGINETWLRTGEGEMFCQSQDTLAEKLARDYGLDELGYQIMSAYLRLDENDRAAVKRLILNLTSTEPAEPPFIPAAQFVLSSVETNPKPDEEEYDSELEAEVERYRQQRRLERYIKTSEASTPAKTG